MISNVKYFGDEKLMNPILKYSKNAPTEYDHPKVTCKIKILKIGINAE